MARAKGGRSSAAESGGAPRLPVRDQTSAGGVAVRGSGQAAEVALIAVGDPARWQLPKGIIDPGEQPEETALREVREEAGIETELVAPIDVIEYWYVGSTPEGRVRFHKRVHFFLLAYRAGNVLDHDREVREARWVPLARAAERLAFRSERAVVERARAMLDGHSG